ncbi:uncharacterized protein LOC141640287 [Silene latifolia]|uniref:uncharacterized protein LOC141640287 n=1 Tax=Silene latifolia TaxID=37657 RepID=UPI003D780E9A
MAHDMLWQSKVPWEKCRRHETNAREEVSVTIEEEAADVVTTEEEAVDSRDWTLAEAEDVASEVAYWETAVVCYVLGSNPPWELLSGFIQKLWGVYKFDKLSFLPNGVFLHGFPMFDNKPVVVKTWTEDCSLMKERVKAVPIWLRLCGLPLKFWSKACLEKLAGLLGKFIRRDAATEDKTPLGFTRLPVEVEIGQEFPDKLYFKDEKGVDVSILVEYEWKPTVCGSCKCIGHNKEMCKKKVVPAPGPKTNAPVPKPPLKVWRLVQKSRPVLAHVGSPAPPFGGVIYHDSSRLPSSIPVIQQVTRQEHNDSRKDIFPTKSYAEALSPKKSTQLNGRLVASPVITVETKVKLHDFTSILHNLGSNWEGINNNSYHHGGRVWIIWVPQLFTVTTLHMNAQVITVLVNERATGDEFFFSVVYGFNEDKVTWTKITDFRACVQYCGLTDIKAQGAFYTWNNKHEPQTRAFSRIDRFLINSEWMDLYPNAYAHFLPEGLFDHNPCVCFRRQVRIRPKGQFRYYNMWSLDDGFQTVVQQAWSRPVRGTLMYQLVHKLRNLKYNLRELNRCNFSYIDKAMGVSKALLDSLKIQLQSNPTDESISVAEKNAANYYRQLSKIQHSFLRLLGTCHSTADVHVPTIRLGNLVTQAHRDILLAAVIDEEIKGCLFSIPGNKSPGPDGYTSQFYKDAWDIVGNDVLCAVKDFFLTGKLLKQLNTTTLTLIPKIDNPASVLDFRPIACCNTLYKCLAKVLCKRLSQVLPDIVSDSQGGHMKLNHLMFADDLLMFCKGTASSIIWILRCFATFYAASGLHMNKSKSEIYFNGATTSTVNNTLQVSGFKSENLPFKYLGIPMSSKKLTKNEGMKLLDKLVARIRGWGIRHLSYAGRLTLVSSVLSTLHTYWVNIFLIPNGILNRVNAICRNFLWAGKSDYGKAPAISWDTCCAPKSKGGLGLRVAKD